MIIKLCFPLLILLFILVSEDAVQAAAEVKILQRMNKENVHPNVMNQQSGGKITSKNVLKKPAPPKSRPQPQTPSQKVKVTKSKDRNARPASAGSARPVKAQIMGQRPASSDGRNILGSNGRHGTPQVATGAGAVQNVVRIHESKRTIHNIMEAVKKMYYEPKKIDKEKEGLSKQNQLIEFLKEEQLVPNLINFVQKLSTTNEFKLPQTQSEMQIEQIEESDPGQEFMVTKKLVHDLYTTTLDLERINLETNPQDAKDHLTKITVLLEKIGKKVPPTAEQISEKVQKFEVEMKALMSGLKKNCKGHNFAVKADQLLKEKHTKVEQLLKELLPELKLSVKFMLHDKNSNFSMLENADKFYNELKERMEMLLGFVHFFLSDTLTSSKLVKLAEEFCEHVAKSSINNLIEKWGQNVDGKSHHQQLTFKEEKVAKEKENIKKVLKKLMQLIQDLVNGEHGLKKIVNDAKIAIFEKKIKSRKIEEVSRAENENVLVKEMPKIQPKLKVKIAPVKKDYQSADPNPKNYLRRTNHFGAPVGQRGNGDAANTRAQVGTGRMRSNLTQRTPKRKDTKSQGLFKPRTKIRTDFRATGSDFRQHATGSDFDIEKDFLTNTVEAGKPLFNDSSMEKVAIVEPTSFQTEQFNLDEDANPLLPPQEHLNLYLNEVNDNLLKATKDDGALLLPLTSKEEPQSDIKKVSAKEMATYKIPIGASNLASKLAEKLVIVFDEENAYKNKQNIVTLKSLKNAITEKQFEIGSPAQNAEKLFYELYLHYVDLSYVQTFAQKSNEFGESPSEVSGEMLAEVEKFNEDVLKWCKNILQAKLSDSSTEDYLILEFAVNFEQSVTILQDMIDGEDQDGLKEIVNEIKSGNALENQ